MKNLPLLAAIILLLASCKKNTTDNINADTYPQKLYLNGVSVKTPLRVYSNGVEVTNPVVIAKFTATGMDVPVYTAADTGTVRFIKADTAMIGGATYRYSVTKNNNQMLFYSPYNVLFYSLTDFNRNILRYLSPYQTTTGTSGFIYIGQEVVVGYGDYKTLNLIKLNYKLTKKTATGPYYSTTNLSGSTFNEFNSLFINTLGPTDTLAVAEYTLSYKVK